MIEIYVLVENARTRKQYDLIQSYNIWLGCVALEFKVSLWFENCCNSYEYKHGGNCFKLSLISTNL